MRGLGHASLKAVLLSGLLGASALGATQVVDQMSAPPAPAWVVYFLAGAACLLFIVKEGRMLLGFPPKRAHEEDLMRQLRELAEGLATFRTEVAMQVTSLEEGRERNSEEIGRLRGVADRFEERLSGALSKQGSQWAASLGQVREDMQRGLDDLRDRVGLLEQTRRRR